MWGGFLYALTKKCAGRAGDWSHHFRPTSQEWSDHKNRMEEFYVVRARGEDVLLRLIRMLREGRIAKKPLNGMDDDARYRTVSIWFDPTSTTSVLS